ncbi:SusC/RagA family TonB-linked outer membrane protein [Parapedobacter tibetensis]|uniref:SusC/RagA family TonB-linked outer membrane protein n=1 Tax=Parapedobacter tibetensis TaxID=2972951 RepID=UPI00214D5703|nr:SusC/RagA family TonB-linked outer membrane protein [Parapedobacter tibetensis]
MKITHFLLTVCLIQVFAETSAQKLTIQRERVGLRTIFSEIHDQTGYSVVYSVKHIEGMPAVTVSLTDMDIQAAMAHILRGLPLDYVITGKEIVIKKKPEARRPSYTGRDNQPQLQQQSLTGRVIDEQGNPLQGAAVRVKGSQLETSTAADGRFTFSNVERNAVIVISFVGYETRELAASADLASIAMKPAVADLSEVVVVGYGTQRKSDITGAVSSIRAEDFTKGTNATFDQLIAGKAAGVQFVQNSGEPGGGVAVRIRGASSVNAGTSPLYVIDGLPIDNSPVAGGGGANFDAPPSPRNPLAGINPEDIESIEILKDASATAIYGSRGANGVIMVTTKNRKGGPEHRVV